MRELNVEEIEVVTGGGPVIIDAPSAGPVIIDAPSAGPVIIDAKYS